MKYKLIKHISNEDGSERKKECCGYFNKLSSAFDYMRENKLTKLDYLGFKNPDKIDTRETQYGIEENNIKILDKD